MGSEPPRLFLCFNHELTPGQRQAAREELGVGSVEPLPEALQRLWLQIPPDLPELTPYLLPLKEWLTRQGRPGDFVLIQGDFGATCLMARYAQEHGLIPVYATTRRISRDEPQPDGSVKTTRLFEHQHFRKFGG